MSGGGIEIRDARLDDLPAVFEIYNAEVRDGVSTFDIEPRDPERDRAWLSERSARHPVLVASQPPDGEIVGWGAISPWSEKAGYDRTAEVSVYVDARRRGEGIGRRLLSALIERARQGDVAVLLARIAGANPASIALHERLGFSRIGVQRRAGEKLGRVLDVVLMDLHVDG